MTDPTPRPGHLTAVFLGSMPFIFLNFGLPIRADELGFGAVAIGGMYAVFTGTMLIVRPLVGHALDRFGRRWFFTSAFIFYCASMTAFARGSGLDDFYFARFLQGIGASLMWVSARTIIADIYAAAERGQAMGKLTTTSTRGAMLGGFYGFTLLGFLPMQEAWMWAFSGYALAALVALFWSINKVKESATHLDPVLGISQLAASEARLLNTLTKLPQSRDLRRLLLVIFLSAFASALIEPLYLLYLRNKFDLDPITLAFLFLPAGLVYATVPQHAGHWSDRFGRGRLIALGVSFAGLTSIALPLWDSVLLVAMFYVLFAVGWSIAGPAEEALIADLSPAHLRGTIIGAKEATAGIGAATGPLLGGAIYDYWSHELAFIINGTLLFCAALLVLRWFRTPAHHKA